MAQFDPDDERWARDWLTQTLDPTVGQWQALEGLLALLAEENQRQNLVARGTIPFAWTRHIVDSAQLIPHVPRETSRTWLDLGTGAGFPGLVCAILLPDVRFSLVEQRPLRTSWLGHAVDALELSNVVIHACRVEQLPDEKFDAISARAFAPLPRLLSLSAAFSTGDTTWVLPKGRSAKQELCELSGWNHLFHVEQSVTDPDSGVIVGTLLGKN